MEVYDQCVAWFNNHILKYHPKPVPVVEVSNKSIELWLINHIANDMHLLSDEKFKFTSESRFVDDLGLDSLDLVELLFAAEARYDIKISNEAAVHIKTIGGAVGLIWFTIRKTKKEAR